MYVSRCRRKNLLLLGPNPNNVRNEVHVCMYVMFSPVRVSTREAVDRVEQLFRDYGPVLGGQGVLEKLSQLRVVDTKDFERHGGAFGRTWAGAMQPVSSFFRIVSCHRTKHGEERRESKREAIKRTRRTCTIEQTSVLLPKVRERFVSRA